MMCVQSMPPSPLPSPESSPVERVVAPHSAPQMRRRSTYEGGGDSTPPGFVRKPSATVFDTPHAVLTPSRSKSAAATARIEVKENRVPLEVTSTGNQPPPPLRPPPRSHVEPLEDALLQHILEAGVPIPVHGDTDLAGARPPPHAVARRDPFLTSDASGGKAPKRMRPTANVAVPRPNAGAFDEAVLRAAADPFEMRDVSLSGMCPPPRYP